MSKNEKQEYCDLAATIIKKQGEILGIDVAVKRAQKVADITIDNEGNVFSMGDKPQQALEKLIKEYEEISGTTALKFCQESANGYLKNHPDLAIPSILQQTINPSMEYFLQSF